MSPPRGLPCTCGDISGIVRSKRVFGDAGETIQLLVRTEKSLLLIRVQRIRPPQFLPVTGPSHMPSESSRRTRKTKQKDAIRTAFVETGRPLSTEEALSYAQRWVPDLGIGTVYRNLKTMVEEGWLTAVQLPGEPPRYEISGKAHHHHFRCDDCRKVYELEGCIPQIKVKLPRGFRARNHVFLLYGLCAACIPKHA